MTLQRTNSSVISGVARGGIVLDCMLGQSLRRAVDCRFCAAHQSGLCQGEGAEHISLEAAGKRLGARQDLFCAGDSCDMVYSLVEGWAFLYVLLEDGRRQILQFALPGALLGFHAGGGAVMAHGVQALTDIAVCGIPRKALGMLAHRHPDLGMRLARLVARDQQFAFDRLTSVGRQTARERVARLLLELHVRSCGQWRGKGNEATQLPLTHEQIGDATGLTFVHVSRVLSDLRAKGVVEFHYRRLRILDADRLVDAAGVDPHIAMSWLPCEPAD